MNEFEPQVGLSIKLNSKNFQLHFPYKNRIYKDSQNHKRQKLKNMLRTRQAFQDNKKIFLLNINIIKYNNKHKENVFGKYLQCKKT